MEEADGGDLEGKIQQAKKMKAFVKEEKIWYIFRQLVDGLVALHDHGIVHRDIKLENLLFTSNDEKNRTVKLTDFGLS